MTTLILFSLLAATPLEQSFEPSFEQRLQRLFSVPFVVRTEPRLIMAGRTPVSDLTIEIANAFLDQVAPQYFDPPTREPLHVVFFEDSRSFRRHTRMDGAFAFYAYDDRTIYTYAGSGPGTLWHEMMHALVEQHYPSCQAQTWFSEGLASFYEMASYSSGKFTDGYTNWRHLYLQRAIKNKSTPTLLELLTSPTFGTAEHLAYARFLFVYLWMHDQLIPFTHAYLQGACSSADPGRAAAADLERLLGKPLHDIERDLLNEAKAHSRDEKLRPVRERASGSKQ